MVSAEVDSDIHLRSRIRGSEIIFTPTPEQVKRFAGLGSSHEPALQDIGFIAPGQIRSYHCSRCNSSYSQSPRVLASIRFAGYGVNGIDAQVGYLCAEGNHLVYVGSVDNPQEIPVEFIELDETGEFKRPTVESIESYLAKVEEDAKKGHGMSLTDSCFSKEFKVLESWANKINYSLPSDRFEKINQQWKEAYLLRLGRDLPKIVGEINDRADYGFSLRRSPEDECSAFEGSGLSERFSRLFEAVENIPVPNDPVLREDIGKVLVLYREMFEHRRNDVVAGIRNLEERLVKENTDVEQARLKVYQLTRKIIETQ